MKTYFVEYYPNCNIKHEIWYHDNGNISKEQFHDEDGIPHRENNLPDFQGWYTDGVLRRKTYCNHGKFHNIYNPADVYFYSNEKIIWKSYYLYDLPYSKLSWMNKIKNI